MLVGAWVIFAPAGCGSPIMYGKTHPDTGNGKVTSSMSGSHRPPSCERNWLTVSIPQQQTNEITRGGTGWEEVLVTTTKRCVMRGWPTFEKVSSSRKRVGTTPSFRESRRGRATTVTVLPDRPAAARVRVRLAKRWVWAGGNICAGFISATVSPPGIGKGYFIFSASPTYPLCAMPAGTRVEVAAWPFREKGGAAA
jgi:hypothetical protein